MHLHLRRRRFGGVAAALLIVCANPLSLAQKPGDTPEAKDMALIG